MLNFEWCTIIWITVVFISTILAIFWLWDCCWQAGTPSPGLHTISCFKGLFEDDLLLPPAPQVYGADSKAKTVTQTHITVMILTGLLQATRACSQVFEAEYFVATSLNLSFMEGKLKLCFHQVQARFLEICPCKQKLQILPTCFCFQSWLNPKVIYLKIWGNFWVRNWSVSKKRRNPNGKKNR